MESERKVMPPAPNNVTRSLNHTGDAVLILSKMAFRLDAVGPAPLVSNDLGSK